MNKQNKNIEAKLLAIVHEFLTQLGAERALQAVTIDASLERELGIDSLKKVELFNLVEKNFSIHLPEKAMIETDTLRDLAKIISQTSYKIVSPLSAQSHSPTIEALSLDLSSLKTLPEILMAYGTQKPQRPHIMLQNENGEERILTYGELYAAAKSVASGLQQREIQPGETVAIMLPTGEEFFYAFCGVLLCGAIPVPIYPPYRPDRIEDYAKREAKILQNAQARILITFSQAKLLSNILQTFVPSLKEVTTLKNLRASIEFASTTIKPHHLALIQYTSGSTGDPKGVTLTHENIMANIKAIGKGIHLHPTDVGVSWLPLYHDMGLMSWLSAMYYALPITIIPPITFVTRPERWLWAIHYHRATISGGPNFAYELCVKKINPYDIEGLDLSTWRFAFNGAEAVNIKTLERFYEKFSRYGFKMEMFAPVYGLAETTVALTFPPEKRSPLIDKIQREAFEKENRAIPTTATTSKDALEILACGTPLPEHEIRIVDDAGFVLPNRTVGNLQFRGPSAMQGYYNNPSATQKAYHDGWWDTGDLGYIVNHELFITGRKKDVIIKAGRNLFPQEIEEVVNQISSIRRGCVVAFGISDATTGTENLVIVAETYQLAERQQQELRGEVIEKMAIMLGIPPDIVVFVPPRTIPKTSSGKLQRSACKQAYIEGKLTRQQLPPKLQFAKLALINLAKKFNSLIFFLGKLIYSIYIAVIALIALPIIWVCVLLLPKRFSSKLMKFSARNLFRLTFCPIKVQGYENIEENKTIIYASNHASYIDTLLLLGTLPAGVVFVGKKELLSVPMIRTFVKKLNHIMVDRLDFSKAQENKKMIAKAIHQGHSIVIFPEGTFTYATGLRPFKLGAFNIAVDTSTPICPISLAGTRAILRGETFFPKPGPIKVTIGSPIYPARK